MTPFEEGYNLFMKLAGETETQGADLREHNEEGRQFTREDVEYEDSSTHPGQECQVCHFYQSDGTCAIVLGKISPHGWGTKFTPRAEA